MKAMVAKHGSVKGRQRNAAAAAAAPKRKGARRKSEIPAGALRRMNRGEEETITLVEFLAVDLRGLTRRALTDGGFPELVKPALAGVDHDRSQMQKLSHIARNLYVAVRGTPKLDRLRTMLGGHPSDLVRHYACHLVAFDERLGFAAKLKAIRPFAADHHMAVREMAWAAVRDDIATQPARAVRALLPWTKSRDANVRRFASEATRPRGVWAEHIEELKTNPAIGLPILEALKADRSRYVQNSVANWLNDASKSDPAWVRRVCRAWERDSPAEETRFIVRRALRTLSGGSRKNG
jgi:3-methyladenine DNA glycosylase AlkC